MIVGILHRGSGIGDQLFSYIATRVRAADLGVDFGFVGKEFFKGASFMDLDWGKEPEGQEYLKYHIEESSGALVLDDPMVTKHAVFVINKPYYDPEFNFIPDGSVIDGYGAQDIRYFEHRLDEVRKWLKVEPLKMPDDLCVINMRGNEYKYVSELYLPFDYWDTAKIKLLETNNLIFEIHTDDPQESFRLPIGGMKTISNIALNWRSIRYAKHLIISNSAFAILPALLNENVKEVIAPFGWNARNKSLTHWEGRPGNYYKKFTYI